MVFIKDIKTSAPHNFYEYTDISGMDMVMCQDARAVGQAYVAEVKTPKGECKGVGLANYGSRLYTLLGENMTDTLQSDVIAIFQEVAKNYTEIRNVDVSVDQFELHKGLIVAKLSVYTIFGPYNTVLKYKEGGCD